MSPCTAKLSAMKNKHYMKHVSPLNPNELRLTEQRAKPQSLFARTSAKNAAASGFAPDGTQKSQGGLEKADL